MEDSQSSLSRERIDLDHAGNSTTTTIPFDLIMEILSLLPGKSLIRFQSVSKLWFSTIRSKTFVDSFLTKSETRPRLLLMFYLLENSQKKFIFSAPEHDDNKSSTVMACRYDMPILEPSDNLTSGSVNGVVCFTSNLCHTVTIYNPTTRQIVKLPDVTLNGRYMHACLGYDPVEDQYKVLCVLIRFGSERQDMQQEHFVCTVSSSQKQEWRKIENPTGDNYSYVSGETCIDGVLYYGAEHSRIVRFHVRSEKIEFIKIPKLEPFITTTYRSALINYKGKLAGVEYSFTKKLMTLWVLEDAEKQEWSSMTCVLPSKWEDLNATYLVFPGVIHTGELMVFGGLLDSSEPFYVCYYDFNKKIIRKFEIQGMKDGDFRRIHGTNKMICYPGHIENIRFL